MEDFKDFEGAGAAVKQENTSKPSWHEYIQSPGAEAQTAFKGKFRPCSNCGQRFKTTLKLWLLCPNCYSNG